MSCLRLHEPHTVAHGGDASDESPRILPFHLYAPRMRNRRAGLNLVNRARVLHDNRCCPDCDDPMVEPLELEDGLFNRNSLPIPGTATIVGFHCQRCHAEWPA